MNYFYAPQASEGIEFLDEEESAHANRALRLKNGDKIGLLDGKGSQYLAIINSSSSKKVNFSILEKKTAAPHHFTIHLLIAPTKNTERMEWLVEKLTEIGVTKISLFFSQNSERRKYRTDRLEKKIIAALKQSKNPFLPELMEPIEFNSVISQVTEEQKFIAYVDHKNPDTLFNKVHKAKNTAILIGPEGDFTKEEVILAENVGFKKISLGKNVLRTETAGLIACHAIHLINS